MIKVTIKNGRMIVEQTFVQRPKLFYEIIEGVRALSKEGSVPYCREFSKALKKAGYLESIEDDSSIYGDPQISLLYQKGEESIRLEVENIDDLEDENHIFAIKSIERAYKN